MLIFKIQHTPVILKRITQRYFGNVEVKTCTPVTSMIALKHCVIDQCCCFSKQHTPVILKRITNKKLVRKITITVVSIGICCGVLYALFKHTPP